MAWRELASQLASRRIGAAPEGVGSTYRGLTHSLELDKEGLMPHRSASTSAVRPCG